MPAGAPCNNQSIAAWSGSLAACRQSCKVHVEHTLFGWTVWLEVRRDLAKNASDTILGPLRQLVIEMKCIAKVRKRLRDDGWVLIQHLVQGLEYAKADGHLVR